MLKADSVDTTTLPGDDPGRQFAALAAVIHPNWHDSILRLANNLEGLSCLIDQIRECKDRDGNFIKRCSVLIEVLIHVVDEWAGDPDLEPSLALFSIHREIEADECEVPEDSEPELGSFDRMTDQTKSWLMANQGELDTADDEPSLGSVSAYGDQELWAIGDRDDREVESDTGIGDMDGLIEQERRQCD